MPCIAQKLGPAMCLRVDLVRDRLTIQLPRAAGLRRVREVLQRRAEGLGFLSEDPVSLLRLTPAGSVLLDASRTVLSLVDHGVNRTRQAAGLGRPCLRVVLPPQLPDALAVQAAAVLTGPGVITGARPRLIRLPRAMISQDMVLAGLDRHPLTATAAVVWNGDLPRPLQQILFDAADGITSPTPLGTGEHEPAAVSQ
jgi:hypothetical protein